MDIGNRHFVQSHRITVIRIITGGGHYRRTALHQLFIKLTAFIVMRQIFYRTITAVDDIRTQLDRIIQRRYNCIILQTAALVFNLEQR